jgi:4'-phosphopantetheinyl transferase
MAGSHRVRFNVAHSKAFVLFGLAKGREIGVDIEHVLEIPGVEELARRFFCPSEYRELLMMRHDDRVRAFFDCWTRKEAFVKAVGDGLSYPLNRVEVTLRPEDPPRFVRIGGMLGLGTKWSLRDVAPSEDHAAAVAVAKPDCGIRVLKFEDAATCAEFFRRQRTFESH